MQIAVKMFKSSMCYLIILFAFITPLSKVNANTNFIKKNEESIDSTSSSEDFNNNLTSFNNDHVLESHELMQQETTEKLFKVPSSDINVSKQTNTFLGGKLVIHEEEPIIDDTDEEPTEDSNILTTPIPTQAMHRDIRQKFQDTEPNPGTSESLLELLITIAGQPERWNKFVGYINTILNSPIAINPEFLKQLESYKTKTTKPDEIKQVTKQTKHSHKQHTQKLLRHDEYKPSEKNHTDTIQHMIIYLRNENSRKHSKKNHFDVSTKPTPLAQTSQYIETEHARTKSLWSMLIPPEKKYKPENIRNQSNENEQKFIDELHDLNKYKKTKLLSELIKNTNFNISKTSNQHGRNFNANQWPLFEDEKENAFTKNFDLANRLYSEPTTVKPPGKLKEWFSFRRVTSSLPSSGYDKARARNAYIAVSVIAPTMRKYYSSRAHQHKKQTTENDPIVNQLLHLKPWNHHDNLKQMKKLREKWPVISTGDPL